MEFDNIDSRGVERGVCNDCECEMYENSKNGCRYCGHAAGLHQNLSNGGKPSRRNSFSPQRYSAPSSPSSPPTCSLPGCTKPVFVENGRVHDYCSRTHAMQGSGNNNYPSSMSRQDSNGPTSLSNKPMSQICRFCLSSARNGTLPFCGKTCADNFQKNCVVCKKRDRFSGSLFCGKTCMNTGENKCRYCYQNNTQPDKPFCSASCADLFWSETKHDSKKECAKEGCSKKPWVHSQGYLEDYCGKNHKNESIELILKDSTEGFELHRLTPEHKKYRGVENQFVTKWTHSPQKPTVLGILQIKNSRTVHKQYEKYKETVEASRNLVSQGKTPGNEQRRFHGTKMSCSLGIDKNANPCTDSACAVCGICRTGFRKMPGNHGWLRFGTGLYFSSVSSKSHTYNQASEKVQNGKKIRVMFLCKVIVGKGCKLYDDNRTLTAPPSGYDSVLGETGSALNYDETVIYDEHGAIPSYLIVYQYD